MQTVLKQGSIDEPLTFDVGLIQLSFIISNQSVHLIHATFQSNCAEGLHFSAFHYYSNARCIYKCTCTCTYMDSSDEQPERGDEEDMVCVTLSEIQNESDVHDITETQTEGNEGDIHDDIDEAINETEP